MQCRSDCGACCIAPSISSKIPGMPAGKDADQYCMQLSEDFKCKIFNHNSRPQVCIDFIPCEDVCGSKRADALKNLKILEQATK